MLYTIRKHPIAFVHCLAWLVLGACIAYVMHYETAGYYEAMYAEACVVIALACLILLPLTLLLGMLLRVFRKQSYAAKKERSYQRYAARQFESTRPGFSRHYVYAVLAAVLPLLALFSVVLVDTYVAGMLLASIGISIWLCFLCYEWSESRLLKVLDTAERFRLQSGAGETLLGSLSRQGDVHGIPQRLWDGRRDYLFNMLLQAGAIDERSTITGHVFTAAEAAAYFGMEEDGAEPVVWIPLQPLLCLTDGRSNAAIRKLFMLSLDHIADRQYETVRNISPDEYPCTSRELRLVPDEDAILRKAGNHLRLCAPTAEDPDSDDCTLYQGCMLQIEDARLHDIKYDYFEDLSPEADREYFLSPEEAQQLYRLLLEDAFAYEICSVTYLDDSRQIALEIWTEPEEMSGHKVRYEAKRFVMDDGMGYLLLLDHEGIKWHWLHTRERL